MPVSILKDPKSLVPWAPVCEEELEVERVGTPLVVQWLRIRLPMQGTWVRSLVREDPISRRATKPVHHNY